MIIYPTIELMEGRCVSLRRGRLEEPIFWDVDPVEAARGFSAAGARWMHITDFDAMVGDDRNRELISEVVRRAGVLVQVAGGFRTQDRIERALEAGVARIVMGTVAVRHPDWVRAMAKYYPDQIVLSVDVWKGKVMVDGWREAAVIPPEVLIEEFAEAPLAAVKITDIDNDLDATEASIGVISRLAADVRAPVIASGLIHTLDDVARHKYVPNIAGALIGRALERETVDLAQAVAVADASREPVAAFV